MKFVAIRDIVAPGDTTAYAYREGELVHESAVEGDGGWLILGIDVEPREGVVLSRPAGNASQGAWAAYAISAGKVSESDAAGMSRADLIALADK